MELTNLQRLGISYLLLQTKEFNPWVQRGIIRFVPNEKSKTINMCVREYRSDKEFVFSLKDDEEISGTIIYEYTYDSYNNYFRIVTIEERGYTA